MISVSHCSTMEQRLGVKATSFPQVGYRDVQPVSCTYFVCLRLDWLRLSSSDSFFVFLPPVIKGY